MYGSPTYNSWLSMKQRCMNKNHNAYHRYWWRWIKICNEWLFDFVFFYNDMWDRPNNYTLDRINNDWNYCKENCRWATKKEQQNNRWIKIKCNFRWKDYTISQFAKICWRNRNFVRYRMYDWKNFEEIFIESKLFIENRKNKK